MFFLYTQSRLFPKYIDIFYKYTGPTSHQMKLNLLNQTY